jgi:hypothetical protein
VALLSFVPLLFADPAHAAVVPAKITCSDGLGNFNTWNVRWNNEEQYFSDKGNIAAHFCEGGFADAFTTFVSVVGANGEELEPALLYYNGIIPETEPPTTPIENTQDVVRPTDDVVRPTEDVVRPSEDVERPTEDVVRPTEDVVRPSEDVVRPSEDVVRPIEDVERPIEEVVEEPALEPEPQPTPEEPVSPVQTITPETGESPQPEPTVPPVSPVEPEISPEVSPEPQIDLGEAIGALINAFQSAGLDMTKEERERAQSVVIPSVMVALVATTSMIRK